MEAKLNQHDNKNAHLYHKLLYISKSIVYETKQQQEKQINLAIV